MSRMLWWVQDDKETQFLFSNKCIEEIPPTHKQEVDRYIINNNSNASLCVGGKGNKGRGGYVSYGNYEILNRDYFLTIFDTCYSFLSDMSDDRVNDIVKEVTNLAKEPMKSSVWKPRAFHHTKLLIDGLCKHRCLFKDYDSSFVAKEEDYKEATKILIRMVQSWDTNLSNKKEY